MARYDASGKLLWLHPSMNLFSVVESAGAFYAFSFTDTTMQFVRISGDGASETLLTSWPLDSSDPPSTTLQVNALVAVNGGVLAEIERDYTYDHTLLFADTSGVRSDLSPHFVPNSSKEP